MYTAVLLPEAYNYSCGDSPQAGVDWRQGGTIPRGGWQAVTTVHARAPQRRTC